MEAVRVTTGSRLHFGLLRLPPRPDWADDGTRYFGGVGLMVERPATIVRLARSESWHAVGPHADRVQSAAQRADPAPLSMTVESAAAAHAGLGLGTQLDLAVAFGVSRLLGRTDAIDELARQQGRGLRSAIGVHGFECGGWMVDAGKRRPDEISPLAERVDFPPEWCVLLLTPDLQSRWHGERERAALALRIPNDPELPAILSAVLPAVHRRDFAGFAAAIGEYNARVGDMFRPLQGGRYGHAAVEAIVAWLTSMGVRGAGQSSWGPTVFGFCNEKDRATQLMTQAREQWGDGLHAVVTTARNRGATIKVMGKK